MRIGLQVPSFTWPGGDAEIGSRFATIARTAEQAGFYSLWVMDHFFQIQNVGKPEEPMLEGYSALSYAAGVTSKIKLGTMVTGVIYRYPGLLVKTATTLDVLSGGRAYFGVGAAWNEHESHGLGVPFPPVKERFERLEEALQIALQMWSGSTAAYHGKHYHLAETLNRPQPIQKPHPPILIGGMGEKKTLKFVAQYADACNLFAFGGADVLRHKLAIIGEYCAKLGRDYHAIEKTALWSTQLGPGATSPQQVIDFCGTMHDAGIQQLILSLRNVSDITPLETFGQEIIPAVASL
ncbi:MAG: LLM class F420-dependent oxidoreductase [Anaerolineae bacterium]